MLVYVFAGLALLVMLIFAKKAAGGVTTMSDTKTVSLNDLITNYAKEFDIPAALIKAVIKQESNWDINAKNPSDPSFGLMQVMPIVFEEFGLIKDYKNVTEADISFMMTPVNNLWAGCKLLRKLMQKYPMDVAVEMYNVGERGYNQLNRRNTIYRQNVMANYSYYLENPNG